MLGPNSNINISIVSSFYPLQLKAYQIVRLICDGASSGLIRHLLLQRFGDLLAATYLTALRIGLTFVVLIF